MTGRQRLRETTTAGRLAENVLDMGGRGGETKGDKKKKKGKETE